MDKKQFVIKSWKENFVSVVFCVDNKVVLEKINHIAKTKKATPKTFKNNF